MNQVVVADPLHVWLLEYWDALRADLVSDNHMREGLADAARVIRAMEPVLESGAVLTTPLLDEPYERNQHFVDEGVLAATDPGFASAVAGSNMAFDPEQLPDEDYDVDAAAIGQMLAGRMEQAYASHARFAPLEPIDWAFLDYWLRRGSDVARQHILHEQQFQMRMINALTLIDLPTFPNLDFKALASVRRDEPTFADWRSELKSAVRHLELIPSSDEFVRTAATTLADALRPRAAAIKRTACRSTTLKQSVKEEYGTVALAGASILGLTTAGVPITYSALTGTLTASAKIVTKTLVAPSPQGTQSVLIGLSRRS